MRTDPKPSSALYSDLSEVLLDREPHSFLVYIYQGKYKLTFRWYKARPTWSASPHTSVQTNTAFRIESSATRPLGRVRNSYRSINSVSTSQKSFSKLQLSIALTSVGPQSHCQVSGSQSDTGQSSNLSPLHATKLLPGRLKHNEVCFQGALGRGAVWTATALEQGIIKTPSSTLDRPVKGHREAENTRLQRDKCAASASGYSELPSPASLTARLSLPLGKEVSTCSHPILNHHDLPAHKALFPQPAALKAKPP